MGRIVFGEEVIGKIDQVPGVCYVATKFFHIQHLPLYPIESYVVVEGTDTGKSFRGVEIPLEPRSVLMGYLRGWSALAAICCLVFGEMAVSTYYGLEAPYFFAMVAASLALIWLIIQARHWWFISHVIFALASITMYLDVWANAPRVLRLDQNNQRIDASRVRGSEDAIWLLAGNVFLFGYSLTRVGDKASAGRAKELTEVLGITSDDLQKFVDLETMTPITSQVDLSYVPSAE